MAKKAQGGGKPAPKKKADKKTPAKTKKVKAAAKKKPVAGHAANVKKKPPIKAPAVEMKAAPASGKPVLHALVIGCDCYLPNNTPDGSYPSLEGCVRDADQVESFLRKRAGLTDDFLIKLTSTTGASGKPAETPNRWPTYENLVNAFRTIAGRARKNDRVYVHYSGHGGQCPTIVPKLKGKNGLDESLVPIDIGNPKSRYLRDVEIAKLLGELGEKGLVVTVVFDSCHSGGATRSVVRREARVGVRGVDFIDRQERPPSMVGTPDELAAAVQPDGQQTRGPEALRGMAAASQASGCVVLAACRPSELAREYPFDGKNMVGALTYWYLNAVLAGPDDLTFRTVYDVVLARIHGQFEAQTPMLLGDADRSILGGVAVKSKPAVPVSDVSKDGKSITLATGLAGLVRVDDEFAIFPPNADLEDDKARIALATVKAVGATSSTAQIDKLFGSRKVQVADRALALGVSQQLVRTFRTAVADKAPVNSAAYLKQVEEAAKGQKWIKLAEAEERADYVVTTSPDGKTFEICDAGGVPLLIRPPLPAGTNDVARRVVDRLIHLARFQSVRTLDNTDAFSTLRGKVLATLFATPKGYSSGDSLQGLKQLGAGPVASGTWVVLEVANQSTTDVNAFVLDLGSNWEITLAHPEERFHQIPRGTSWQLPLQVSLAEGQTSGSDVLKVIATVDPPPPFEPLLLPPLDNPIEARAVRGNLKSSGGLATLLEAVGADLPTRSVSTGGVPTRGWTVAHTRIEIG